MKYLIMNTGLDQNLGGVIQKVTLAVGYEDVRPAIEGKVIECVTVEDAGLAMNMALNHLLDNIVGTLKADGHETIADELLIKLNKQIEEKLQ